MKIPSFFLFLLLFVLPAQARQDEAPASDDVKAFVGVTVLPMDSEQVLPGHTVVVRGDRIVAVGPQDATEVPEGALRIDGSGKYLIPGLAEMHGHIPPPTDAPAFIENVLFLYVANGITTVRGMLGHPGQLALRDQANRGEIVAPSLYLAGPGFSGNTVGSPEEAIARVKEQKEEGWNLLKVFPGLSRETYDAMARTAHEVQIRFGGHVPGDVGILHALEMGQETIDHLDGYLAYIDSDAGPLNASTSRLAEVVARTKEAGAWVVPTMALWETLEGVASLETLRGLPELAYMPPDLVQQWVKAHEERLGNPAFDAAAAQRVIDQRMQLLTALYEGGVGILMGTDAPQQFSVPGFSLHRELERMADAGMTPYDILVSGTRNVGTYFANEDAFGTIAPGQRADLILLAANPLEDISHVARRDGVMVRGRWLTEQAIQERLAEIAAAYAAGADGSN